MIEKAVHLISWGGSDIDISVDGDGDILFVYEEGVFDFLLNPAELVSALKELGVIE